MTISILEWTNHYKKYWGVYIQSHLSFLGLLIQLTGINMS